MKQRTTSSLLTVTIAVATFVLGVFAGSRVAGYHDSEMIRALQLSHSSLTATRYVQLLRALRDGHHDAVIERLESDLDLALIDLAREYAPRRDPYSGAAKTLALAREYRAAHPRTTTLESVDQEVHSALATKADSPAQ